MSGGGGGGESKTKVTYPGWVKNNVNMVMPEIVRTYQQQRDQGPNQATADALWSINQIARTPSGLHGNASQALNEIMASGGMNPAASGLANSLVGGQFVNPAMGGIQHIAAGREVGTNPYLDATYNRAAQSVTRNFNDVLVPQMDRSFIGSGRTGSGMYAQARGSAEEKVGGTLNDLATSVYGGAYESERGRQMQALGQLGALGQQDVANRLSGAGLMDQGLARRMAGTQLAGAVEAMRYQPADRLYQLGETQSYLPYRNQLQFLDILSRTPGYNGAGQTSAGGTGPSPMGGAMTGALGGAASGAMIGSVVPVVGTGLGALAGGVLGGAAGYFGSQ